MAVAVAVAVASIEIKLFMTKLRYIVYYFDSFFAFFSREERKRGASAMQCEYIANGEWRTGKWAKIAHNHK